MLDAFVEDLPSPVMKGAITVGEMTLEPAPDGDMIAFVFKTLADPFAGRINLFRVLTGQQQSELVIVGSTLAIAALFTPLRRRPARTRERRRPR